MAGPTEYDVLVDDDDAPTGEILVHGGTDVKQGMRGQSRRAEERGRDEFQGNGASAAYDMGRTEQAGRHYGRSGPEEPGPGYGRGPLQPQEGTVAHAENDGVDFDELRQPESYAPPDRPQARHGEDDFAQGRDEGQRKQMSPDDGQEKHEEPEKAVTPRKVTRITARKAPAKPAAKKPTAKAAAKKPTGGRATTRRAAAKKSTGGGARKAAPKKRATTPRKKSPRTK